MLLDGGTDDAEKDGADADLDGVAALGTLLACVLGAAEDAGLLLIETLEIFAEPGVVGVATLGETADNGEESVTVVVTVTSVVVVGAAKAGVASTSPQARVAMELLR